jgi:23S rRNA pseudouridine1911/1915/1917 synthase
MPATPPPLDVLFEDNHILAVNKPPRLLTAGDRTGDVSLLDMAREYLRAKYSKPGKVYLGVVHRLDRPVSGVVLFARTSKAAARLSEQFRLRTPVKIYQCLVEGDVTAANGSLVDWVRKDTVLNVVEIVAADSVEAQRCVLHYRRLRRIGSRSLLEVTLETGRSHQIRVQLAHAGMPICGDTKYGSRVRLGGAIALHAASITFDHPVRHVPITVTAEFPAEWPVAGGR